MKYRLLGLDLDGTLLDDRGRVSRANRDALARAEEAGLKVVPCTGRGWRESRDVLGDLPGLDIGVFVTGAAVVSLPEGTAVDLSIIEPHLAMEITEFLATEPEAVLVYREPGLAGYDYLVTGQGELNASTEWWFKQSRATVHFQNRIDLESMHHALRIGLVAEARRLPELSQRLAKHFGDRVLLHHFEVFQQDGPNASIHVLEVFAAGTDKWRGLSWIAQERGIPAEEIAAIGDSVNDLSMLEQAGCGIAMRNASDDARRCARCVTEANTHDGVARAIDRLLDGTW
ncbi:MAG: HAD-IIB family hydrolase [Phycisphaeraceae bacterium]